MSAKKIGVFDSGIGGLTVLKQLMHLLPNESFIYFGDTARLPYGGKSGETIIRYSVENSSRLLEKNVKMIVVACNTASSYALDHLREIVKIPVIGVIEPSVACAIKSSVNKRIGVLGTKATINSQAYQKAILSKIPDAHITAIACPLLVPLIEEQYGEREATRLIVQEYLRPLSHEKIDTLLLGCTHYPLLQKLIRSEIGSHVHIVDSASSCAWFVADALRERNMMAPDDHRREMVYMVSDDPHKFQQLGRVLLDLTIDKIECV